MISKIKGSYSMIKSMKRKNQQIEKIKEIKNFK